MIQKKITLNIPTIGHLTSVTIYLTDFYLEILNSYQKFWILTFTTLNDRHYANKIMENFNAKISDMNLEFLNKISSETLHLTGTKWKYFEYNQKFLLSRNVLWNIFHKTWLKFLVCLVQKRSFLSDYPRH